MDKRDERQFKEILEATIEVIDPRRKLSVIALGIWLEAMRPYSIDQVRKAFSAYIKLPGKGQFVPKPADIVEILDGSAQDNAFQAWSKASKAIGQVGSYQDICFDDPIINLVIQDMGGWIGLCQTNEEELKFRGHEFCKRYQAYSASAELPTHPKQLYGLASSENHGKGLEYKEPVKFVGDHNAALLVFRGGKEKKALQVSEATNLIEMKKVD